jgi:hypothetical protein
LRTFDAILSNNMFLLKRSSGFLILFLLFSCKNDRLNVDTSAVEIKIEALNIDSILWNSTESNLLVSHQNLKKDHQDSYFYLLSSCLQIQSPQDTVVINAINQFKQDDYVQKLENELQSGYFNLNEIHGNITLGFRNLKYHLPKQNFPESIWYANSLFASSAFAGEKELIIGLERYLGKADPLIQQLPGDIFFEWIKEDMNKVFLERDALSSWIYTHIIEEPKGNLAESIVFWGKVLYLTEAAFPKKDKNELLRYSKDEFIWAEENVNTFWDYLVKEELLFGTDERQKNNLLNPGPFTIGLPEKGPDRLGQYLGWKLIHDFVDEHEVSIEELIKTPYNKILQSYDNN